MNEDDKDKSLENNDNDNSSHDSVTEDQSKVVTNNENDSEKPISEENQPSNENSNDNIETETEKGSEKSEHQVIHRKEDRLHIYVRQDKYKGELKSKNWVGRLYIDGKQKISSSGTTNLEEAIPILEKWFDDVHAESEKLKQQEAQKKEELAKQEQITTSEQTTAKEEQVVSEQTQVSNQDIKPTLSENKNVSTNLIQEDNKKEEVSKVSSFFGKFKNIKLKKPSLAGLKSTSSKTSASNNLKSKLQSFFKSKLGKSTVQGEEILGVEISNKEIRLAQISSNKANQWVLEKFFTHKLELPDESTVIDNAEKITEELKLSLQKNKIVIPNVAISIPVTSAIIRVVTSPLMKDEELQKAIDTNSLWENLVQLTDNLDDYSIFHQVINRNEKDNTMDILFVASKLSDINSYTEIIKNAGLNAVIIDVKCFALKSAVDQINQISNKIEDANLTAVLEFSLDENYLMILYDNNPIITDIFLRGLDRKILLGSEDIEEKEGLVRRYTTQVKQAIQDFETKYEKRIRSIKVVSDIENIDQYLSFFRKNLSNVSFNLFDPMEGLQIPKQFEEKVSLSNRSYFTTAIGLAFRKLDVFGYYKFVTAVKNINLLPNRQSMFKQKKMKAISGFAFKGLAGTIAAIYLILFGLSFWNIHSYNKQLKDYNNVKALHIKKGKENKKISKELKLYTTTLKLSKTLKSNKDLTYRVLAQIASSVPKRVRFDEVDYNGKYTVTIQGIASSDQDILKFIENLGNKNLIEQASLSSMRLPKQTVGGATMKGFRVFVKIKRG
tara:strand:- start:3519 stop:5861 length:2343 start_codon:yes stop_codon:yes gene_type:complete